MVQRFGENGVEVKKLRPSLIFNAQLRLDKEGVGVAAFL
jgi:hypothetical protein